MAKTHVQLTLPGRIDSDSRIPPCEVFAKKLTVELCYSVYPSNSLLYHTSIKQLKEGVHTYEAKLWSHLWRQINSKSVTVTVDMPPPLPPPPPPPLKISPVKIYSLYIYGNLLPPQPRGNIFLGIIDTLVFAITSSKWGKNAFKIVTLLSIIFWLEVPKLWYACVDRLNFRTLKFSLKFYSNGVNLPTKTPPVGFSIT